MASNADAKTAFSTLYLNLFNADPVKGNAIKKLKHDIDDLEVLKKRTPVSLVITYDLLYASYEDSSNDHSKRAIYCFALIRFSDIIIAAFLKHTDAESRMEAIEELELPSFVKEFPDIISKGNLPTIEVLRQNASEAITYLDQRYWKPTYEAYVYKHEVFQDEIAIQMNCQLIKFGSCRENPSQFESSYLQFSIAQMKELLKEDKKICLSTIADYLIYKGINGTFNIEDKLPHSVEEFFFPLIEMVHAFEAIPDLTIYLIQKSQELDKNSQEISTLWIAKFMNMGLKKDMQDGRTRRICQTLNFVWPRIVPLCYANATPSMSRLLKLITADGYIESKREERKFVAGHLLFTTFVEK